MASERVGRAPYSRPCPDFGTRVPGKAPGHGASGDSFPISWPHLGPKPREVRGTGGGVGVPGPCSSLLPLTPCSSPARKVLIRTIGVLLRSLPGQFHLLLCGPKPGLGLLLPAPCSLPSSCALSSFTWPLTHTLVSILSLFPVNPSRLMGWHKCLSLGPLPGTLTHNKNPADP